MKIYLELFLLAALLSYLATDLIRLLGRRLRAYGGVRPGRLKVETPRLGGIAIFCALLGVCLLTVFDPRLAPASFAAQGNRLAALLIPAVLVLAIGALDDLSGATPFQKLAVLTIAADALWIGGVRLTEVPVLGWPLQSPLLSFLATTLWIVAVANAFNLTDGIDGLTAGTGCVVALTLLAFAIRHRSVFECVLAVALCGALMGFLRSNLSPAAVYLGDTGSLFLGFFLAALTVLISRFESPSPGTIVLFAAFGYPLLEMAVTIVRRLLSGRPLFVADRNHFHDRLLRTTGSPRRVVLMLYGWAGIFPFGSLVLMRATGSSKVVAGYLVVSSWLLTTSLQYEEFSQLMNIILTRAGAVRRRVTYRIYAFANPRAPKCLIRSKVLRETSATRP